jgi:hypothetical protein
MMMMTIFGITQVLVTSGFHPIFYNWGRKANALYNTQINTNNKVVEKCSIFFEERDLAIKMLYVK